MKLGPQGYMEGVKEAVGHRQTPPTHVTQHAHVHAQIAPLIKPLILRVFEDRFESLWPGSLTSTEL